jgi:hypothetical protein
MAEKMLSVERLGIPITVAASVITSVVGVTLWAMNVVQREAQSIRTEHTSDTQRVTLELINVKNTLVTTRDEISRLANAVDGGVTRAQFTSWCAILSARNPNLSIPELPPGR